MLNIQDFFKTHEPLLFFLVIFFLISPGIIYTFFWHRELFVALDWVKLSILSISALVPVALLNAFVSLAIEKSEPTKTGRELVEAFTLASIFSGFFGVLALVITHFNNLLIFNLILVETMFIAAIWWDARKRLK
jgi:hypothetical protein